MPEGDGPTPAGIGTSVPRPGRWCGRGSPTSGARNRLPGACSARGDSRSATRRSIATSGSTVPKGGTLYQQLRGDRKQRRKRYGCYDSRGRLAGKRTITERPAIVEGRTQVGHWEGDTVLGAGQAGPCVLTLVERKTGYLVLGQLRQRTTTAVTQRATQMIRREARPVRTITVDNGTEFHDYAAIEHQTATRFYFATPHHSWERGTNENTNGLLRQYLPKGHSMAHLTQAACDRLAGKLNRRPRKRLAFRTPEECYAR